MSPAPLLSIIVVAYKSRDEIGACLSSLPTTLDGRSVEIVVVDNSPGDGAGAIVQREFSWVRYIAAEENLGFGRANNLGFAAADERAEFVLLLNPDTVCNAAAIAHCVARLEADAHIGLISPKLVLADGTMDLACRRSIPNLWDGFCRASGLAASFPRVATFAGYNLTHLPENGTYEVGAINGAFMMGPRAVFAAVAAGAKMPVETGAVGLKKNADSKPAAESERPKPARASGTGPTGTPRAGVFDEQFFMYGDDLDLCIRVARAGWKIIYDGRVAITHVKGVSVAKEYAAMSRAIFDANRDVYLKHFNPHDSTLVRWKYTLAFGAWKRIARLRARWRGSRQVRPG